MYTHTHPLKSPLTHPLTNLNSVLGKSLCLILLNSPSRRPCTFTMSSLKAYLIFLTVVTLSSPLGKETANSVNTSLRPHYLNHLRRFYLEYVVLI